MTNPYIPPLFFLGMTHRTQNFENEKKKLLLELVRGSRLLFFKQKGALQKKKLV